MRISDWSSDVCSSDLHRLLQLVDGIVHLQRRQHAGVEGGVLHAFLAAADAEEPVAGPRQNDHTGSGLAADPLDAIADFLAGDRGEHVPVIGPVQGDPADRAVLLVQDRFETPGFGTLGIGTLGIDRHDGSLPLASAAADPPGVLPQPSVLGRNPRGPPPSVSLTFQIGYTY